MAYAVQIGWRHLRARKRGTVATIAAVAVGGVALGVGALLTVLSITTGFQREFRAKVLGVNAHVLVLKYGLDFEEYRDVVARAEAMPQVAGAAPFVVREMMAVSGDRIQGVLVKGVDPERVGRVLDLPKQLVAGSLEGLRLPGARPPEPPLSDDPGDLDALLRSLWETKPLERPSERTPSAAEPGVDAERDAPAAPGGSAPDQAPLVDPSRIASPEEIEALLQDTEPQLPDEAHEAALLAEDEERADGDASKGPLPGSVLGRQLAEKLGVKLGETVRLVSPTAGLDLSAWTGSETPRPRSRSFKVVGIFEAGFQEYDTRLAYVDLYEAQRLYDQRDVVTGVELRLHDLGRSREVARQLEQMLDGPFHTMDWAELNHNLFTALELQKIVLALVIASIIVVAAFNVVATLILVVLDRRHEIAILKAMGASDATVLGVFLVQGLFVGLLGTAIGLLLGGGATLYLQHVRFPLDPKVYLIDHLPVVVRPTEFAVTTLVAVLIALLATLVPSAWAARLLPAEGLRR